MRSFQKILKISVDKLLEVTGTDRQRLIFWTPLSDKKIKSIPYKTDLKRGS